MLRIVTPLIALILAACGGSVDELGWTDDGTGVREAFIASGVIDAKDGDWSPAISEGERAYRAIWYSQDDRDLDVRLWYDRSGNVERVSATGLVDGGEPERRRLALAVLTAAAPSTSAPDRQAAADAGAKTLRPGGKTRVDFHQFEVGGTSGYRHFTVALARP